MTTFGNYLIGQAQVVGGRRAGQRWMVGFSSVTHEGLLRVGHPQQCQHSVIW